MSFDALADEIIATIAAAPTVVAVVSAQWPQKTLTVKKGFKTRQEINVADLPVCLIVRPERKRTLQYVKQYDHSFILFVGCHCDNREEAPGLLDALENAIEDTLTEAYTLGGTAVEVHYISSVNDMGMYHPVYFTTMQFDISARK
jgi:hypothetical protein